MILKKEPTSKQSSNSDELKKRVLELEQKNLEKEHKIQEL